MKNLHFIKCMWELYRHKSINRVPVCAAVQFERCSALPEVEKNYLFFCKLCSLDKNNVI